MWCAEVLTLILLIAPLEPKLRVRHELLRELAATPTEKALLATADQWREMYERERVRNSLLHAEVRLCRGICHGVCPDLNSDGRVDGDDLYFFSECQTGPCIPMRPCCERADFDGDGDVDQSDFGIFQNYLWR